MFSENSGVDMETVKINSHTLQLPAELCSNEAIFNQFFSFETWKSLSPAIREHLTSNFLPDFCDDNLEEKEKTINTLLSRQIVNFNTEVLSKLQRSLASGHGSTGNKKKHKKRWPSKRDKIKSFEECQRVCRMMKKLSKSRSSCLFESNSNKIVLNTSEHSPRSAFQIYRRSIKRYFSELENLSMLDDAELSSDDLEDYHVIEMGCKRRKLNINDKTVNDNDVNGEVLAKSDDNWYKETLLSHETDKSTIKEVYDSINMRDVFERTQLDVRKQRTHIKPLIKKPTIKHGRIGKPKASRSVIESDNQIKKQDQTFGVINVKSEPKFEIKTEKNNRDEDMTGNRNLKPLKRDFTGTIKDSGNLPDLDAMGIIQMPLDFTDVDNITLLDELNATKMPELLQETHACYLSLIRDVLCSTPDHRMSLDELKRKINFWLLNPITPLNDWYHQSDNWFGLLPSAVHFLTGEFTDQPEDFVPYLEYKAHLNIYQWIGAGRDADNNLVPLCKYWLSRRNDMGTNKRLSSLPSFELDESFSMSNTTDDLFDGSISPPPVRFPTDWIVRKATPAEIEDFREQERRRYENPHMPFTFYQHGYESVVGPIKGIYTQQSVGITKAREHNMLVQNRPNFVTILTLVRDAVARLPNGEGSRSDICELLKSSQYISPTAGDQVLQTIVSGALDRMHTEPDPCVKYDPKRKFWIYLHRNRSESDFEKMHLQQQQCIARPKKIVCKKTKPKPEKVVITKALPVMSLQTNPNTIVEKKLGDAKNIIAPMKTAIRKFIPQTSTNTSPKVEVKSNTIVSPSKNIRNIVVSAPTSKNNSQNFVTAKIGTQKLQTIQYSPTPGFVKVSANSQVNSIKIKTNQNNVTSDNNKIVFQNNQLSELGKIGIMPQKVIQVSPNRFQTNNKGNVLTLNKIPVSLANYTGNLNKKVIQVKPMSGSISNLTTAEGLPALRRANIQIKAPTTISNAVATSKIVSPSVRSTSMLTVKNIKPLPTISMTSIKEDLPTVKVQSMTKTSPLPVFITKTSDGMTIVNANRPLIQTSAASRPVISKPSQSDTKPKFGIISPNRSLLLTDKTQKTGNPVTQIVRVTNPNSVKTISGPLSGIKVQQIPASSPIQKDSNVKNVTQLVNAKIINVQPQNADNKLKTISGIRMIKTSDLNIASINGKQVIIATKSLIGNQNPQNVVFQASNCSKISNNKQTITLSKNNLSGQPTVGPPIILPKLQGGSPINVKTMQGIKIIPFTPTGVSQLGTTAKFIQASSIMKNPESTNNK
ncbi:nuclear factor related to kappa-B-binding protein isoform X2 [Culicoides brevitarsis]|uniref:nuclear factor related to kappa-B-binding protein isoform X2 n=1 Tax=Culicoides brevitarsis TaxID=469753 RepID=UPI00307CA942